MPIVPNIYFPDPKDLSFIYDGELKYPERLDRWLQYYEGKKPQYLKYEKTPLGKLLYRRYRYLGSVYHPEIVTRKTLDNSFRIPAVFLFRLSTLELSVFIVSHVLLSSSAVLMDTECLSKLISDYLPLDRRSVTKYLEILLSFGALSKDSEGNVGIYDLTHQSLDSCLYELKFNFAGDEGFSGIRPIDLYGYTVTIPSLVFLSFNKKEARTFHFSLCYSLCLIVKQRVVKWGVDNILGVGELGSSLQEFRKNTFRLLRLQQTGGFAGSGKCKNTWAKKYRIKWSQAPMTPVSFHPYRTDSFDGSDNYEQRPVPVMGDFYNYMKSRGSASLGLVNFWSTFTFDSLPPMECCKNPKMMRALLNSASGRRYLGEYKMSEVFKSVKRLKFLKRTRFIPGIDYSSYFSKSAGALGEVMITYPSIRSIGPTFAHSGVKFSPTFSTIGESSSDIRQSLIRKIGSREL